MKHDRLLTRYPDLAPLPESQRRALMKRAKRRAANDGRLWLLIVCCVGGMGIGAFIAVELLWPLLDSLTSPLGLKKIHLWRIVLTATLTVIGLGVIYLVTRVSVSLERDAVVLELKLLQWESLTAAGMTAPISGIAESERRRRRWRVAFQIAAAVMGVVLLLAWPVAVVWTDWELKREIAAIRASGDPIEWDQLSPLDHAGAGHLYAAAFSLVTADQEQQDALEDAQWDRESDPHEERDDAWDLDNMMMEETPTLSERVRQALLDRLPLDDVDTLLLDEMLSRNERALALLHEAAAMDVCRFIHITQPVRWPVLPALVPAGDAGNLLRLQASGRMLRGDAGGAVDAVIALVRLTRIGHDQPVLNVHMVSRTIASLAAMSAGDLMCHQRLSAPDLERLRKALTELNHEDLLGRVMVAERIAQYHWLDGMRYDANDRHSPSIAFEPVRRRMTRDVMRDMGKVIEGVRKPWPHPLHAHDIEPESRLSARFRSGHRRFLIEAMHLTQIRASLAAIAVERYRLDHGGALPESLEALTPRYFAAVPIDPRVGKPLRFTIHDVGYTVYGLGENGVEDGGDVRAQETTAYSTHHGDWGVNVTR